jgi:tripartite-type tricarboxylate transporter receptor subunit TctC
LSVDWRVWSAIYAPAGTSRPIIDQLYSAYNTALQKPDLKEKLSPYAIVPLIDYTPEKLSALQREQFETRKIILGKIGVVPD